MKIILIFVSILLFGLQSFALRKISIRNLHENLIVTGFSAGIITLILGTVVVIQSMQGYTWNPLSIVYGAMMGVAFLATLSVYYFAMQRGPLSYTNFFFSSSMLIPAAVGLFFWNEPWTISVQAGILLFIIAFFFITTLGQKDKIHANLMWFVLCFFTWLLNGILSVISVLHQRIFAQENAISKSMQLEFIAFLAAFLISIIIFISGSNRERRQRDLSKIKKNFLNLFFVAIGTGGGNVLVAYLSASVPSSYLLPLVQGGTMVVVTLYSVLFLREKLTFMGVVGVAISVAAICIINL